MPDAVERLYDRSIQSAALELRYERSSFLVDIIAKDEDIRRLRFDANILEDDNDELRGLLTQETARSDAFERMIQENQGKAQAGEARLYELERKLMEREQSLSRYNIEREALERQSKQGLTAAVADKLHLQQQLADMRIELEHHQAQAAIAEALKLERNNLQRQTNDLQLEIENAKREVKRALAKRRNTGVEIAQEEQVEDLKRQLSKEKRARRRLEEAAEASQSDIGLHEVRKALAQEKRARHKAEEQLEEVQNATQVDDIRNELLREKKIKQRLESELEVCKAELESQTKVSMQACKKAEADSSIEPQMDKLREQLTEEAKMRGKLEKDAERAAREFTAQKEILEEKLNQFRKKLRSTKDRLQSVEAQLSATKAGTATAASEKLSLSTLRHKEPRKRGASDFDVDATNLGTPGDRPVAKRSRNASTVGDKSTFSITPFLNRTMNVERDDAHGKDNETDSPARSKLPLTEQSPSKDNAKRRRKAERDQKAPPVLDVVQEEVEDVPSQAHENAPADLFVKTKTGDTPSKPKPKSRPKLRKSIHDFAAFNIAEPEVKKKRKLVGMGKTLFDEENDAVPGKPLPSRGLFGGTNIIGLGGRKGAVLGSVKPALGRIMATDGSGFQFSPLKRSRRTNLDDTLRG